MGYVIALIFGTIVSWISLLIVVPIAQKIADFSFPPWSEALWKLAVVAAAGNAVSVFLGPVNFWLSTIAGAVIFWIIMWRWFDMDFFGLVVISGAGTILRSIAMIVVLGLIS